MKTALVLMVMAGAAIAQPEQRPTAKNPTAKSPTESVTVTGVKDVEKAVTDFVGNMTAPTRVAGKMARWRDKVCPVTVGLRPEVAKFVTRHVKDMAAQVGAPVNDSESCKPNIEIVFTTQPQILLDNIRVEHPSVLGYHDSNKQAIQMAAVTHPIQSWYATGTRDLRGQVQADGVKTGGMTLDMPMPGGGGGIVTSATGYTTMNMPNARLSEVTGSRLGDGLSSEFSHVVIVAEPAKLLEHEMGTLADYIAVLALSQPPSLDSCQALPTILNLLAGCADPPKAITSGDLAFLRALYKVTPSASFQAQRGEMIYQMDKTLMDKDQAPH